MIVLRLPAKEVTPLINTLPAKASLYLLATKEVRKMEKYTIWHPALDTESIEPLIPILDEIFAEILEQANHDNSQALLQVLAAIKNPA